MLLPSAYPLRPGLAPPQLLHRVLHVLLSEDTFAVQRLHQRSNLPHVGDGHFL